MVRSIIINLLLVFFYGCSSGGGDGGSSSPVVPEVPKITIVAQDVNVTILDPLTNLSFTIDSIEDIESFQVKINNIDRTELVTLVGDVLEIQPTSTTPLPFDYLIITLILTDVEGYTYTQTFDFSVDFEISISSGFSAVPQIGYAPLTVTFSPKVSSEESIQLYHWDFGDGTLNDSNTSRENLIGSPVNHTYAQAGDYTVVLTIYDSTYQPATSQLIVKVFNQPPVITSIDASPSNGDFPLNTNFSVSAIDNEGIREFLWDFNGDGVVDYNDSNVDVNVTSFPTSDSSYYIYTYDTVGEYQAILTITDVNGYSTVVEVPTISVLVGPVGTPTITAYAYPTSGDAPLNVNLSTSWDSSYTKFEWDFDGDGIFDYSSATTGNVNHIYSVAGTYYAHLQVTNSSGLKSSDTIEITVNQDVSLTRSVDTIDVKNAESVDISVTIAGLSETTLLIENNRYQPIVTLLEWQERSGALNVSWDGTNSEGVVVSEGDYYVVLLYKEGGETKRFDLRDERINYDRPLSTNVSAGDVFAPYLEPMLIEFNLTEASEVSLDIGPDGIPVTERIKTLLLKKPLGKGFYRLEWAGDANDGTLADLSEYKEKYPSDADYYMTGGFSNKLALNAVYVKSGVSISSLQSDTPIYTPNAKDSKKLSFSFELSADASVTLSVNDAKSGATVITKQYASLTEGSQVIEWDGKNEDGKYVAPGVYRVGVKATDKYGYSSLTQYALQRVFY